jgi:hypothetical protein
MPAKLFGDMVQQPLGTHCRPAGWGGSLSVNTLQSSHSRGLRFTKPLPAMVRRLGRRFGAPRMTRFKLT